MLGHSRPPLKSYPGEDALALPPLQLGPEDREELLLRETHEANPRGGLHHLRGVVLPEAHPDLAVHGDHDVLVRHERDLDPMHSGEDDRPVRQGVGADRRQHDRVHRRKQDRPTGGEAVGGRAGRRRDDQADRARHGEEGAVAAEDDEQVRVRGQLRLGHARDAGRRDQPGGLLLEHRGKPPRPEPLEKLLDRGPRLRRAGLRHDADALHASASTLLSIMDSRSLTARREHAEHRGQDLLQRDERDVDDRERRLLAEDPRVERPRVGLLHDHHAGVLAQLGVELAHADVHGVHAGGAALEQAVGEAAGRGAHVEADAAGDLHLESVERVGELLAAPAHERRAPLELDARVSGDQGAGLAPAPAGPEALARQDEAGGLLPALDEPALDDQAVDALARRGLGHALHYRRPSRRGRSRNSSTIPARNPPMCANHAIPPVSPPPSADALTVIRPLTNWTTIQKPSTTRAGTYTNRTKNPKTRSTSTRAYGNRSR